MLALPQTAADTIESSNRGTGSIPHWLSLCCSKSAQPAPVDGPIERLKAGEYIWAPEIAPDGPVTIIVSLTLQRAYAYRNGVPIGTSTISSGKAGHETPLGVFVILQKDIDHKSNLYDGAPMPFMQRLTWDGVAMHAGNVPGYPASHGCIRLPAAFAKLRFGTTKIGLTVVVTDDASVPEVVPVPSVLVASQPNTGLPAMCGNRSGRLQALCLL